MKLRDYLPLKAVTDDLGVSRWTLWRAAASNIPDFPKPTRVGRQVFWKKSEVEALEAALMQFKGRCVFDNKRKHEKKVRALAKSRAVAAPRKRAVRVVQQDFFGTHSND
jgi:predicted DNA-binding transcriptional regulator AlpA